MTTTRSALTEQDIRTLVKGGSADERAVVAHRLCRHMDRHELTDEEREEAHTILRIMAQDAAELVRRALAITLKSSPLVPRDVANKLARDVVGKGRGRLRVHEQVPGHGKRTSTLTGGP